MARLEVGAVVGHGKYQLERVLGTGGMGVVWLASEVADSTKHHAIKFVTGPDGMSESFRKRFYREARAAMTVNHPNVVRIHEVLEDDDGEPMLVMEVLVGMSLGERLDKSGPLSLTETMSVMLPVVAAVGAAHAAGVVHRDIKPDNIFLVRESDGHVDVRVLDFGIAKVATMEPHDVQTAGLTLTGSMLGTPNYMSPEQATGEKNVDAQTDVWSIGVILFECLTGELPVVGENLGQLIKGIVTGRVKRLETVAPHLPRELIELVNSCLRVERSERPWNLREVFETLRALSTTERPHWVGTIPPARVGPFESAPTLHGNPAEAFSTRESGRDVSAQGSVVERNATRATHVGAPRRFFVTGVLLGTATIGAAALTVLFQPAAPPPPKDQGLTVTIASSGSAASPARPASVAAAVVPESPVASSTALASPPTVDTAAASSVVAATTERPKSTGPRVGPRPVGGAAHPHERDAGASKLQGGVAGEVPF